MNDEDGYTQRLDETEEVLEGEVVSPEAEKEMENLPVPVSRESERATEEAEGISPQIPEAVLMDVLLDESGSMGGLEDAVIQGQNEMIDALQGASTRYGIQIAQWKFAGQSQLLHGYKSIYGADPQELKLSSSEYSPGGKTRLYDTIVGAWDANTDHKANQMGKNEGQSIRSIVAVLTDGEDTESQTSLGAVQRVVQDQVNEFRGGQLYLIGIGTDLNDLGSQLGLDPNCVVNLDKSAKEIRRAFQLISSAGLGKKF